MPVLENFRLAFSPDPTDCPWVSEDAFSTAHINTICMLFTYFQERFQIIYDEKVHPINVDGRPKSVEM